MIPTLELLAARYWEASQGLRGRGGLDRKMAVTFLTSQATHPVHPLIEARCHRTLAETGLAGIERLEPGDTEPAA